MIFQAFLSTVFSKSNLRTLDETCVDEPNSSCRDVAWPWACENTLIGKCDKTCLDRGNYSQCSPIIDTESTQPVTTSDENAININDIVWISRPEIEAMEELLKLPLKDSIHSMRTASNDIVEAITPLSSSNPENVMRVESIMDQEDWDYLFAVAAKEYDYKKFLQAVGKFPSFCGLYEDGRDSDKICRKSLATMFAHFSQETGEHDIHNKQIAPWRQGLHWVREMGWIEGQRGGYNGECNPLTWQGEAFPCGQYEDGEFMSYFGRGAKQLSYNYNYGQFSQFMFDDVTVLLNDPARVADTWLNLASAIFFYVYPQSPKPSMLQAIDMTWTPNEHDKADGIESGFGVTINIINGGVECGGDNEMAQSLNRIEYYRNFAAYFNVEIPDDEKLGCAGMKQYGEYSSAKVPSYWENDWSWSADTLGNFSYKCQLIGYQTAFSAYIEGDYEKCLLKSFPNVRITEEHEQQWIENYNGKDDVLRVEYEQDRRHEQQELDVLRVEYEQDRRIH